MKLKCEEKYNLSVTSGDFSMLVICDICAFNLLGSIDSADTEVLRGLPPPGFATGATIGISATSSSSSSSESSAAGFLATAGAAAFTLFVCMYVCMGTGRMGKKLEWEGVSSYKKCPS